MEVEIYKSKTIKKMTNYKKTNNFKNKIKNNKKTKKKIKSNKTMITILIKRTKIAKAWAILWQGKTKNLEPPLLQQGLSLIFNNSKGGLNSTLLNKQLSQPFISYKYRTKSMI